MGPVNLQGSGFWEGVRGATGLPLLGELTRQTVGEVQPDQLPEAQAIARGEIERRRGNMTDAITRAMDEAIAAIGTESADALAAKTAGGASAWADTATELAAELARLREQAAAARAAAEARRAEGGEGMGLEGEVAAVRGGGAAASFSAAALRALGQGGSPMDRIARAVERHKKVAEEMLPVEKEIRDKISYMERLLTMTP
jgi:hypothetical protein